MTDDDTEGDISSRQEGFRQQSTETSKSVPLALLITVIHLVFGSVGVAATTALAWSASQEVIQVFIPAFTHRLANHLLLELPGFPLQTVQGLYLGFVLSRRLGGRISQFCWSLLYSWLASSG